MINLHSYRVNGRLSKTTMQADAIHGRESFRVMPEEELVWLAHEGDQNATEFIIDRYKPYVLNRARTYFVAGADKEDVMQEGMIGLLKAIRDYRADKRTAFKPFVEVCVTRQIITAVKAATRNKHNILNGSVSLEAEVGDGRGTTLSEQIPDNRMATPQDFVGIEGMLSGLSELENDVMRFYLEGRSYQEIGEAVGMNRKAVDNAIQRIRIKICNSLEA